MGRRWARWAHAGDAGGRKQALGWAQAGDMHAGAGERAGERGARGRRAQGAWGAAAGAQGVAAGAAGVRGAWGTWGARGLVAGRAAWAHGLAKGCALGALGLFWPGLTRYFS